MRGEKDVELADVCSRWTSSSRSKMSAMIKSWSDGQGRGRSNKFVCLLTVILWRPSPNKNMDPWRLVGISLFCLVYMHETSMVWYLNHSALARSISPLTRLLSRSPSILRSSTCCAGMFLRRIHPLVVLPSPSVRFPCRVDKSTTRGDEENLMTSR